MAGTIEADLFRSQTLEIETRSSDPPDPSPGQRWLRTDLRDLDNDTYGEYRWYDGSSVGTVSVVVPGTTPDIGVEVHRIQTPDGTGVIPRAPRADSKFPGQTLYHEGQTLGLGVSVSTLIDDFEDSDLSEYDGDTGAFDVTSGSVNIEGDYALSYTGSSSAIMTSQSGLPSYPSRGDVFSYLRRDRYSSGQYTGFLYGVSDSSNFYYARLDPVDDVLQLLKSSGGSYTVVGGTSVSSPDTNKSWLEIEVAWHDGSGSRPDNTHVLTAYEVDTDLTRESELGSFETTDSEFASETGVGWRGAGGSVDNICDLAQVLGSV